MESTRASFLEKAAHLTYTRSPSTSAHLISEQQALARSTQAVTRSQNTDACQRCGTLATGVWKSKSATVRRTKSSSSRKPLPTPTMRTMVRRCDACGNVAKLSIQPKVKPSPLRKVQTSSATLAAPDSHSSPSSSVRARDEPKLSSKKRAKARKDRDGLQVLLNKKKPSSTTQPMTLMDFMKP